MLLGSEGIARRDHRGVGARPGRGPRFKSSAGVTFATSRPGAEAVRALSQSGLYPSNCRLLDPARGRADRAPPTTRRAAGARLRVRRPSGRRLDGPGAGAVPATTAGRSGEAEGVRRRRPVGAWRQAFLRAPYLRDVFVAAGILERHLRDRDHLGPVPGVPRAPSQAAAERPCARSAAPGPRDVPVHPRLSGRAGALLHRARAGAPRRGARAVGRDQVGRRGGGDRGGRDDHAPPRGRPRPPALVRPPAAGALRRARWRARRRRSTRAGSSTPGS